MSTQLAPFAAGFNLSQAAIPAAIRQYGTTDEMQQGIGASFAVVSIKGKTFTIKHGGTDHPLMVNANGASFAAPFFDVVLVAASANLTKTYYKDGYVDGSDASPDCWSEDGVRPASATPVASQCAICPMNVFGSKIGPGDKKLKACTDSRKLILVPAHDIANDTYGGAMLMRVPAASLGPIADYSKALNQAGVPFFAVVTRIQFDASAAYPKLTMQAIRYLTEAEAAQVLELRNSPRVADILTGSATTAPALPPPAAAPLPQTQAEAVAQYAPRPPVMEAPAPILPPVPVAPPAPVVVAFPPEGWTAHPDASGYFYKGQEVLTEAQLRERMAPPVPQIPVAPPVPVAPPIPAAPPVAALPGAVLPPAPAQNLGAVPLDQGFMSKLDGLLGTLPQ
jgi:hypothetical protein